MKRKVISESGNQDRRWAHVQKLIPCPPHTHTHTHTHTDTQQARAFIDGGGTTCRNSTVSSYGHLETGHQWSDHCLLDCFKYS